MEILEYLTLRKSYTTTARSESDVFEKEDNGTITVREGASFDNLNVTFDEVITDPLGKEDHSLTKIS